MQIYSPNPIRPTAISTPKKGEKAGSKFSIARASQEIGANSGISDVSYVTGIDIILALQENGQGQSESQRGKLLGETLLEKLENLHKSLLSGGVPHATLEELQHILENYKHDFQDPKLIDIMNEIEVRAAVELAKYEYASLNLSC